MGTLVAMKGITKTFHGVCALNKIDLDLNEGEVHLLLGENGAGKSTLMKILSGVYEPVSYTHLDVYKRQEEGWHVSGRDSFLTYFYSDTVSFLEYFPCLLYTSYLHIQLESAARGAFEAVGRAGL